MTFWLGSSKKNVPSVQAPTKRRALAITQGVALPVAMMLDGQVGRPVLTGSVAAGTSTSRITLASEPQAAQVSASVELCQ